MAAIGPVILTVVGQARSTPSDIQSIIWEGNTASGDSVTLVEDSTGRLLWAGRTDTTQTYLGVSWSGGGLRAAGGFRVSQMSAGRLFVYLNEN